MAESSDLQALAKITSEVDESHVKVLLSIQCIKAQRFLVDRLKKKSEKQKEMCKSITSGNLKLEAEIKHAEHEMQSLLTALETLKSSNVEIKKEMLLAKERKCETLLRLQTGEKKYEDLWIECKRRYETIPYVQKLFDYSNKSQQLTNHLNFLDVEENKVIDYIKEKKQALKKAEQQSIIEMAKFIVEIRPNLMQNIKDKMKYLDKLTEDFAKLTRDNKNKHVTNAISVIKESPDIPLQIGDWPSLSENFHQTALKMPTLQLANVDYDVLNFDLEQIEKVITPTKRDYLMSSSTENPVKKIKIEDKSQDLYTSAYFSKSYLNMEAVDDKKAIDNNFAKKRLINILEDIKVDGRNVSKIVSKVNVNAMKEAVDDKKAIENNFAKKRLINILEDIKVDGRNVSKIVSKVNINAMKEVNIISGEQSNKELYQNLVTNEETEPMDYEEIETEDLAASATEVLVPPTQFLDNTQNTPNQSQKKQVLFDLPVIIEEVITEDMTDKVADKGEDAMRQNEEGNTTANSQLDLSAGDESFNKIKEMILKKNNLDLSPDFIYTKKELKQDDFVTSKFFKTSNSTEGDTKTQTKKSIDVADHNPEADDERINQGMAPGDDNEEIEICQDKNIFKQEKNVSGLLFTHGPNGIPDSLDVSINTTGFDDGDFPHCIDSSLLLSPKADIPVATISDNTEIISQEAPNFLSGIRKTGFSFFGQSSAPDSKPDSSGNNQGNNFNFNFCDDKKGRGGLFSMFR